MNTKRTAPRLSGGVRKGAQAAASIVLMLLAVAAMLAGDVAKTTNASSHREAPFIAGDPEADNTDLYAFRSPDAPNTVTIVANYVPLEQSQGGPNFYKFGDNVLYELKVDYDGDGQEDINYQFRFKTEVSNPNT